MSRARPRGEAARKFIIENLDAHPNDIVRLTAAKFHCSRQAAHKHLHRLVVEGAVTEDGNTRNKSYRLAPLSDWRRSFAIDGDLREDRVWRENVSRELRGLPENVLAIWQYGFTEMLNNAIDHSEGSRVLVSILRTAASTRIDLSDDGVGIFRKIQGALGLADDRHAVLELAKGKFTTDPVNHSGEGIFFSSRMFDSFAILSGGVYFSHPFAEQEDWILQADDAPGTTLVRMTVDNHTARTVKKVFDKFSSSEDYGFTKTVVPVRLMKYGDDNLVSRSQAHRLLARVDRFKIVILDFSGVASIGQAFSDEVFRVFRARHPGVQLIPTNTTAEVRRMISRAESLAQVSKAES